MASRKAHLMNCLAILWMVVLYVPIRFFSESVGKTINWDPETYTVSANTTEEKKDDKEKLPERQNQERRGLLLAEVVVAAVKPSLDSIKADAEARLSALQSNASATLHALYAQYLANT